MICAWSMLDPPPTTERGLKSFRLLFVWRKSEQKSLLPETCLSLPEIVYLFEIQSSRPGRSHALPYNEDKRLAHCLAPASRWLKPPGRKCKTGPPFYPVWGTGLFIVTFIFRREPKKARKEETAADALTTHWGSFCLSRLPSFGKAQEGTHQWLSVVS